MKENLEMELKQKGALEKCAVCGAIGSSSTAGGAEIKMVSWKA